MRYLFAPAGFCSPFIVTTTTRLDLLFTLFVPLLFLFVILLDDFVECTCFTVDTVTGVIYTVLLVHIWINQSIVLLDAWGNIYTWLLILLLLSQVFASVRWCPFPTWGDYLPPYLDYFSVNLMVPVSGYPVIIYRGDMKQMHIMLLTSVFRRHYLMLLPILFLACGDIQVGLFMCEEMCVFVLKGE